MHTCLHIPLVRTDFPVTLFAVDFFRSEHKLFALAPRVVVAFPGVIKINVCSVFENPNTNKCI